MHQQPFDDDPDKEKKIKELELLLMSAENEIRRKRVSSVRTFCINIMMANDFLLCIF